MARDATVRQISEAAARAYAMPRQHTYAQNILLREIELALFHRSLTALWHLERLLDANGLPPDPRVTEFLREHREKLYVRR